VDQLDGMRIIGADTEYPRRQSRRHGMATGVVVFGAFFKSLLNERDAYFQIDFFRVLPQRA
jgi:hypothetical protein